MEEGYKAFLEYLCLRVEECTKGSDETTLPSEYGLLPRHLVYHSEITGIELGKLNEPEVLQRLLKLIEREEMYEFCAAIDYAIRLFSDIEKEGH